MSGVLGLLSSICRTFNKSTPVPATKQISRKRATAQANLHKVKRSYDISASAAYGTYKLDLDSTGQIKQYTTPNSFIYSSHFLQPYICNLLI